METSTTSDLLSGNSITSSNSIDDKSSVSKTWIYILILLALFGFLYYILSASASQENMSGGTVTQLLSQDLQDVNLTGGPNGITDNLSTGQFQMYWNQPTRNGGNRANYSPIPINTQKNNKMNDLTSVNPSNLKLDNTPFPRINPKSTASPYPNIKNILINQKEDDDMMQRELSKEVIRDQITNNSKSSPRVNTMRSGAMNTLQNALVNSCKNCVPGKCDSCPTCRNGLTSYPNRFVEPDADSVASNKVDAKSIGRLENDSGLEYESVENFDSGLGFSSMPSKTHRVLTKRLVRKQENFDSGIGLGSSTMPSKLHATLSNKIVGTHPMFANANNDEVENFDSGLSSSSMPSKTHRRLTKRLVRRQENFDSGIGLGSSTMPSKLHSNLSNKLVGTHPLFANANDDEVENFDSGLGSSNMPAKLHRRLSKRLVKKQENFDDDENDDDENDDDENDDDENDDDNNPLRANTGTCANCPQARCVNCPMRTNECSTANCPLGYPCKTCKTLSFLNDRDQIVDSDNSKENFANAPTPTPTPSTNSVKTILKKYPVIDNRDLFNGNLDNNSSNLKLENFDCPCKRKVITATNLNQRYINNNEDFTSMNSSNSQNRENKENFQCSLNSDNTECIGCVSQCPCRFGNCASCPNCRRGACTSCPNRRCPCLMGRCKDCPACKSGNCPMCPNRRCPCLMGRCKDCPACKLGNCPMCTMCSKNKIESTNKTNENFSTVGFDSLCPCAGNRCANCPECRMGKCPSCPRSNQSNQSSNFIDLASLGTWHGGARLGSNWNNATTSPMSVNVNDSVTFYPDSYVGSYFINPQFDIMKPYPVIPPSRTVSGLIVDSDN